MLRPLAASELDPHGTDGEHEHQSEAPARASAGEDSRESRAMQEKYHRDFEE